jgi:hypothetical protein
MTLTKKDCKQLFHLLDELQVRLERDIESGIKKQIEDDDPQRTHKLMTLKPDNTSKALGTALRRDRMDWRVAEDFKIRLCNAWAADSLPDANASDE